MLLSTLLRYFPVRFLPRSRTVKWLADEAYRRRQLLLDQEASAPGTGHIRIRTSDGALLLPTDLLCAVLPAATGSHTTTPELMAEIVQPNKPPQVPLRIPPSGKIHFNFSRSIPLHYHSFESFLLILKNVSTTVE